MPSGAESSLSYAVSSWAAGSGVIPENTGAAVRGQA
jgi:hypothetical protein